MKMNDSTDKRGKRPLLRWAVLCAAVLAAVALAGLWQLDSMDSVRRLLSYGGERGETLHHYRYNRDSSNRFVLTQDGLGVLSRSDWTLYNSDGTERYHQQVSFQEPALCSGGNCVAAYDVGGEQLYLVQGDTLRLDYRTQEGQSILSARLSDSGWLTVVAGETGYRATASVYDASGELAFVLRSSQHDLTDAVVTEDGKRVILSELDAENGNFVNHLVVYPLDETEPCATGTLSDSLVWELAEQDGRITAICEEQLAVFDAEGSCKGSYLYGGGYLRDWDCAGEGFTLLQFGQYKSGSAGDLITVDASGKLSGSVPLHKEVLDLSAAGRYCAVLYADSLVLYTDTLTEYAVWDEIEDARGVLLREDGSLLLLGASQAWLVLP